MKTGYAPPVVSRGRLYLFEREGNLARLLCLTSETGHFLWKFEYPTLYEDYFGYNNGPRCSPIVDEDRVYILGAEGMLHCLTAAAGEVVWRVDTARDFGVIPNFFGVGSAPVVEGDLLIVQVGGSTADSRGRDFADLEGNGSGVVAFDKRTGVVRYKLSDELASYASPVTAAMGGRRWCFVFARGGLLAFDPATGRQDFHFPWRAPVLESVNAANPVVVGDRVFISETYGPGSALLAVRPGGYDLVWADSSRSRQKAMQTHWNTCIAHKGFLYGSSGRHTYNAELRCIEMETGRVRWSEPGLGRASLLYVDEHLISIGESKGELILFRANPERFEEVSRVTLAEPSRGPSLAGFGPGPLLGTDCWSAPVLAHGLLYVRGDERMVCLEVIPQTP
jgi:outer membrane protein assembly factor BamB